MPSGKNNSSIGWKIAYKILTHSQEKLTLFMMHPGDDQYDCLALLSCEPGRYAPKLLITLGGSSLFEGNAAIAPYPELYTQNKTKLMARISQEFGIRLSPQPVRDCAGAAYLMKLASMQDIDVRPTWYDGSSSCRLEAAADGFPHYPAGGSGSVVDHYPWWMIFFKEKLLALVNVASASLIDVNGAVYDLNVQEDEAMDALKHGMLEEVFSAVVQETQHLLDQNDEWRDRYRQYAERITQNKPVIRKIRSGFREWAPLKFYLNTTAALNAKRTVNIELRYYGQTVAKLTGNDAGKLTLSTTGFEKTNLRDFDCSLELHGADWAGADAAAFRKFFKDRIGPRKKGQNSGNEEHRMESLWLTELLKPGKKALPNVKAVDVGGVRFPMPTPISASDHKAVKYSGIRGGGIDIFTRTGTGGSNTYLCIMELKDENVRTEPPRDALKQAVAYTTFIRALLRSDAGASWWRIFGFNGPVPEQLVLYAACVMPNSEHNDYSFKGMEIPVGGDVIRLHYVYFTEKDNHIINVDTSLVWS